MILHVNFSDGSNPWVCFSDDIPELADHWRDWVKYHPTTANIKAYNGDYICKPANDRSGYLVYKHNDFFDTVKQYKYLGNALKSLSQKGGKKA